MAELARWLFERYAIPYAEEVHAPILHVLATRRAGGGVEIPVVTCAEGVWSGAREFLLRLDAKTREGDRLLGETPEERTANLVFIDRLFDLLLKQVRRFVYFHLLPERRLTIPIAVQGAPLWERVFVAGLYPLWRYLMGKGLDLSPQKVAEAPTDIKQACSLVESKLGQMPFLNGEQPGSLDVIFAALLAPVVFPSEYGAFLPKIDDLPEALRDFVEGCRNSTSGQLVLRTYAAARPMRQPTLKQSRDFNLPRLLFGPSVQLAAARLVLRLIPRLSIGRFALFARWRDVQEILSRDLDFLIAPLNSPSINEVNGPFVLGMDRSDVHARERRQMYAALHTIDLSALRDRTVRQAQFLLKSAAENGGRLDVVNGYARLVAARNASSLFGVRGPTEAELMSAVRAAFSHLFLNLGGDQKIRARALAAGVPLEQWIMKEVRKRASGNPREDVIGALLRRRSVDPDALDDDGIRRNISGLLIGSIDTTATAVAQIVAVLFAHPEALAAARRDVDDPVRWPGWCWEALRFWPHNPILRRTGRARVSLDGLSFRQETTVVAFTLAAMHDPSAFAFPERFDPCRTAERYLHFGAGLHPCAGRVINAVQVPELVRLLLKFGAGSVRAPSFDGPFIDELVVQLSIR